VKAIEDKIDLDKTLFIVSSKSGGTIETMSLYEHFWSLQPNAAQYVAITDPGSSLAMLAADRDFRRTFLNDPDIGGRYSALSYFGLVPAALIGVDVAKLLHRAHRMAESCGQYVPAFQNPAAWLGAIMGEAALAGQDKLTFVLSSSLATFGLWVEQLIAESTGKQGKGIVPVEGEPVGKPAVYGDDRLFAYIRMDGDPPNRAVSALEKAGQPVVTLTMRDKLDLGGEFLRWEIATAVAGALLGIDPFDQPNVQESKDNTKRLLGELESSGKLNDIDLVPIADANGKIGALLATAKPGDYVALTEYIAPSPQRDKTIAQIRETIARELRVATTTGYGPRFLHSTGQAYKGGPDSGVFLQITADDDEDLKVPGQKASFGIIKAAQARGDFDVLTERGRRALRVHLKGDLGSGLSALDAAIAEALS
jgi:transaldolase/glucose-6-phosphate isomerase